MSKQVNSIKQLPVQKDIRRILLYCGIIAGITFIAFLPSLNNGFANIDDDYYVIDNPDIRGFTLHNLVKVFSSKYVDNYQPLTMLTYMTEYHFFQLNPTVYHCTNLFLHIINCLLVFALFYGLSGRYLTGLLVALLFAIHPMRVESVAWIAERKDVLSSFFYFLSLLSYIRYLKKGDRKFYYWCGLSLLFSLLSKPMAVSQPFVLLLIDYVSNKKPDKKTLLDKIPFFAMAVVFAAIALLTQKVSLPNLEYASLSTLQRICIPFYGMAFYVVKSIVPIHLCSYFPFPAASDGGMTFMLFAAPFLVIAGAAAVYYFRGYSRKLVFGSLFFFITALPVLQIVPVGGAIVAERYTYIPMLGIYFIFAALFTFLLKKKFRDSHTIKTLLIVGVSIPIIIFACITNYRCGVWKDSFSLWNDVIAKNPVAIAYIGRGSAWNGKADYDHAIEDFDRALTLHPASALASLAYNNRGTAYNGKGDYNRAIEDFNQAIELDSKYIDAYYNRGVAYSYKGDYDRAIEDYTQAIRLKPTYTFAYCNRGVAYCYKDDYDRAIEDFSQAIMLNPMDAQAYNTRGLAYKAKNDYVLASYDFKKACNLGFDPACKQLSGN
jgi:tetratricopeptide (TPR) repeat protein